MISPYELKPGNLIYLRLSEDDLQVIKIISIDILKDTINNNPFSAYEYIPITEQWLKRAGFIRPSIWKSYQLNIDLPLAKRYRIEAGFTNNGWHLNLWLNNTVTSESKHYVHELQNLYQEIKGDRLSFNGSRKRKEHLNSILNCDA